MIIANNTVIHSTYVTENKTSVFGDYQALIRQNWQLQVRRNNATVTGIREQQKKMHYEILSFSLLLCW